MLELAKDCLALAHAGLRRRKRLDSEGRDETRYLGPLDDFVARGITPAEELLEKFDGPWGRLGRAGVRRIRVLNSRQALMAKGTPATVALTKAGVAFKLHEYDYDPNAGAHRHAGGGRARRRSRRAC